MVAAFVWRAFADRDARSPSRRSWLVLIVSAVVLFGLSFGLGQYWQHEIRRLMGVTDYNALATVACPFVAALVFLLLLLAGRGSGPCTTGPPTCSGAGSAGGRRGWSAGSWWRAWRGPRSPGCC